MVMFLFQMVFMDTAATIVTGAAAERWKFAAFSISTLFLGAITYPLYGNWAWGGGWLSQLGANYDIGHGYCDFAGSGVVHAVGGMSALAVAMIIGPRIGKYRRDGKPNPMPGHDITMVLLGCFILAFGWFGFNPGSTLGASGEWQSPYWLDRGQYDARGMHRIVRFAALHVDPLRQAGCLDGGKWFVGRTGRDNRTKRIR